MVMNKLIIRQLLVVILATLFYCPTSLAQDDPFFVANYPYVNYEKNVIIDPSGRFSDTLAHCLVRLIDGNEKFSIAHIGDSHIQADFFTGKVRNRLQCLHPGVSGTRGLIFPYNLAGTNNPGNYRIESPNRWEALWSTKIKEPTNIGLYGIKITTTDTLIEFIVRINDTITEPFNEIALWYGSGSVGKVTVFDGQKVTTTAIETIRNGVALVTLPQYCQQVKIIVELMDSSYFDLFGIEFRDDLPGLEYHAIGVNGASAASNNRSLLFTSQLRLLKPSLIVLSIGTNDAYNFPFSEEWFLMEYSILLDSIQRACPGTPILLTTPNDHSRKGADMSRNMDIINRTILTLAKKRKMAFWDFFEIMGGNKSIDYWFIDSLAARDKIHLSPRGYNLKAELFYIALLKVFDKKISEINGSK
jgi:lysophospholipase L1-like esterase